MLNLIKFSHKMDSSSSSTVSRYSTTPTQLLFFSCAPSLLLSPRAETYDELSTPILQFGPVLHNHEQGRMFAKLQNSNVDYEYSDEMEFSDNFKYLATLVPKIVDSKNIQVSVFLGGERLIQKRISMSSVSLLKSICGIGFINDGRAGQVQFDNILLTTDETVAATRMSYYIVEKPDLIVEETRTYGNGTGPRDKDLRPPHVVLLFDCSRRLSGLYAHPSDCAQFIVCNSGYTYEMQCPAGLHFNPAPLVCDYPESAKCGTVL